MDKPTLVLAGANLPTVSPEADSLLIRDGEIVAVGRYQDLERPAGVVVRDLAGATVLPGLVDSHVHFAATGFLETAINCLEQDSLQALLDEVRRRAERKAPGQLVLGLCLDADRFAEKRNPTLGELTAAAPDNPVYLRHRTGHSSFANALALELLDFSPGQRGVALDDQHEPTGYIFADATQLATQEMYALNAEQLGYAAAFEAAAARAVAAGCTAVHALDDLEAVRELVTMAPRLPVRVLPYTQSFDVAAVKSLGLSRIGGCHGCALDGDFDMHTAALLEPYLNTDAYGILYHNDMSLQGFVNHAHSDGLQIAFHAVGDRAVEQALEVFERAQERFPRPDPRHRIEHAQLITEEQIARARRAGVVISVQPAFNHVWPHHVTYPPYIGERAARVDPIASLARAGIVLAGGSDSTVTDMAPLLGIHAAVNHSRAEERLSIAEAVDIFTSGAAYSTFSERRRGQVAAGFDADLTITAEDPFAVAPERLKDLKTLMTVVGGEVVFEA